MPELCGRETRAEEGLDTRLLQSCADAGVGPARRWPMRAGGVCAFYPDSELRYPHRSTVRDRIDPELIKGIWWETRPRKLSSMED